MNKNNTYIVGGILAVAIIVLYILHFTSKPGKGAANSADFVTMMSDSSVTLPVAYVNVDSLLMNYNFAKDLNEALMRTEESSRASLAQRQRQLQSAAEDFERKRQNNAFLTPERGQQEAQRIMKMQQEYEQMAQRLTQEFALEQQKLNHELNDTVRVRLQEFNKTKGLQVIFSNTAGDNILFAEKKYDITEEVIAFLNKRYGPSTSAPAATESEKKEKTSEK